MDVGELLKEAWKAVEISGVPKELQAVAFSTAVEMLRDTRELPDAAQVKTRDASGKQATPKKVRRSSPPRASSSDEGSALPNVGTQADFFRRVAKETNVTVEALGDIFHVENGSLELKVASKDLGSTKKSQMQTIAVIVAGAYFAGTETPKVPFAAIYPIFKSKRCFDQANAATYLKSLPGFSALGNGSSQHLSTKSGWHAEFAKAVGRVLQLDQGTS